MVCVSAWRMSEGHVVRVRQDASGQRGEEFGSPTVIHPTGESYLLIDSERRIFGRETLGVHGLLHHHCHSPPGILGVMGRELVKHSRGLSKKKRKKGTRKFQWYRFRPHRLFCFSGRDKFWTFCPLWCHKGCQRLAWGNSHHGQTGQKLHPLMAWLQMPCLCPLPRGRHKETLQFGREL